MRNFLKGRRKLILIVAIFIGIFLLYNTFSEKDKEISYDTLISYIQADEVSKIETVEDSSTVSITLADGETKTCMIPSIEEFTTFISDKIQNGSKIEFTVKTENELFSYIFSLFLTFGPLGLMFAFLPRMMEGKKYDVKPFISKVRFSDVAGIEEEKEQLIEIVQFLKHPKAYTSNGAKIPKGILLYGAPGTGKTLLAKAIAGEAGVPFFQVTGSSFEEKFVGVGASRMRQLFTTAKRVSPCIIFIDEIDSVAQARYGSKSHGEQTLNQLLAEMDGFNTKNNVIVIAATNHIDVLDPALVRPGRFDRHVFIPMPDMIAREQILTVHARNKKFADDVSLAEVARKTVGFSGADLENILNEATIYSVNQGNGTITKDAIDESIARVIVGLSKKNSAITEEDKYITAVHEAGHAIVSAVARPNIKNFAISIVPRGNAGGYNFFDEFDKKYHSKEDLLNNIQVLYGGLIAENLIIGSFSTGASNDLEKASKIANQMVTKFGMSKSLLTKIPGENDFNNTLIETKLSEIEEICNAAHEAATTIINSKSEQIKSLANLLIEKEYLSQDDIDAFVAENL